MSDASDAPPACQLKGCAREGQWHPRLVFHIVHGKRTWEAFAICGLVICSPHRSTIRKPSDILGDGGAQLIEALEGMRDGAKVDRIEVGFIHYGSVDAVTFRRLRKESPS